MEYQVKPSALNHHIVIDKFIPLPWAPSTWYEFTWNHSVVIQVWKVKNLRAETHSHVRVFSDRQLMAEIPAFAPDGDPATLGDVVGIVKRYIVDNFAVEQAPMQTNSIRHGEQVG